MSYNVFSPFKIIYRTIGSVNQLEEVFINTNNFAGPLTTELFAFAKEIYIQDNLWSGSIPPSIFFSPQLRIFHASANCFTGVVDLGI